MNTQGTSLGIKTIPWFKYTVTRISSKTLKADNTHKDKPCLHRRGETQSFYSVKNTDLISPY